MNTAGSALSRDNAVSTAIALLDAQGPDALTMRALAREMDVPVMSLYRHVASRDDLERSIVATLVSGVALGATDGVSWDTAMREWAVNYRTMLRRHPNAASLMAAFPAAAYGARPDNGEWLLAALVDEGLHPNDARVHLRAALITITGFCTTQVTAARLAASDPTPGPPPADEYPLLAALVDDVREGRHGEAVFQSMLDAVMGALHAAIAAARAAR